MDNRVKRLFYSPLTERIYFGNGVPLKGSPNVYTVRGDQTDVTPSFFDCLLQKFPPGDTYTIRVNDKPLYELTIKKIDGA